MTEDEKIHLFLRCRMEVYDRLPPDVRKMLQEEEVRWIEMEIRQKAYNMMLTHLHS